MKRRHAALFSLCALWTACAPALSPAPNVPSEELPQTPAALYAEIRALLRQADEEPEGKHREELAVQAVRLGQQCDQIAAGNALCDYGLALALGVQARERPSTAHDGLAIMEKRLQRAAATDPALDHAGPERVLGLLLVRAPGWPTGPGDPEAGLASARKAAARNPDYAPNWLAVAEAADVLDDANTREHAARTALALAQRAAQTGEPKAADWERDANKLFTK